MNRSPSSDSLAVCGSRPPARELPRTSTSLARVSRVLDSFASRDHNGEMLTAVRHYPAREAQWAEFPGWVHPDLRAAYNAKGIRSLYTHQAAAAERVHAGKNLVVVTPTASGKPSAATCPFSTPFSQTPILAPSTFSPPRPSRKTNSQNSTT